MKISDFVKSRCWVICFFIIVLTLFLYVMKSLNYSLTEYLILALFFLLVFTVWMITDYIIRSARIKRLKRLLNSLDHKYLAAEIIPEPADPLEYYYFEIIREISRSAIGLAEKENRDKTEYMEYVERWVHEIKTPLTACSLIIDNEGSYSSLKRELKKADNLTESILYYARLKENGSSTCISEFSVSGSVNECIRSQKLLLISSGCSIEISGDFTVCSDKKAFEFIIVQLLVNCAKYCKGSKIEISAEKNILKVKDYGPGIPSYEIKKITAKGYTGKAHSDNSTSTGMGLYLVSRLCSHLDIGLNISSEEGKYTEISLTFHNLTKM